MGSIDENPASIREKFDEFFAKKNIEEQCTAESLEELHEAFLAADEARMDESQLREAFDNILKIRVKPEEMRTLFTKINSKRTGFVTWDEFVSHVMLEFQDKDISWQWQALEPPLTGLPILLKTHHRSPITRILFCPEILPDRTSNFLRGCYITASRDGIMNYWSVDLEYRRTVQSVNPFRKIRPTVITDVIAMPDVQIVCTSSTERDLRFYDTVAKKFDLRVMVERRKSRKEYFDREIAYGLENCTFVPNSQISSLECPVVCMGYYFSVDISESSYILLGNTSGSVIIMSFNPSEKGPFKHFPHQDLAHHRYEAVVKGDLAGLQVTEFRNVHSNWLSQVSYYAPLRAFVSCSKCSKCSLLLSDPTGTKMQYKFIVDKGISCFVYCEENQLLVTGGPDCTIRMWNPFVTRKPSMILLGHHAAICAIVVQNSGKRLYTLAKNRCIKVWDVGAQSCIQTYNGLPGELGEHTDLSIIYNDVTHEMIIASMMIAVIVCERVIDQEASDGFTHTQGVSCVLYNSLFKVIVSVGLDSCIIVWDPWLGRRLHFVTKAHSQLHFGKKIGVEITAACFDTTEQLLLTGARDGTLKLWNFNTGTCLRTMSVEENCEITSALWLKNRILCAGWDRRVTEFADTDTGTHKKSWEIRHTEHVLCASVSYPQALATASYNGEIVLWRLETGQPYRRYQVSDPTRRYKIVYRREPKFDAPKAARLRSARRPVASKVTGASTIPHIDETGIDRSALAITGTVPVRSIMFLASREANPETGSLLVSLQSGLIQVWTHHTAAGFLTAFMAVHSQGDYALSLATDPDNEFLLTGHAAGYIKVWLLKNYVLPNPPKVCVPLLRLEFAFMWRDRILGRAKRAIRDQPLPLLLSSIQGHTGAINSLLFIPEARIVVSGSEDHTVRLWTLNGRYISTLGTFRSWATILPDTPASEYLTNYRIPPDIERIASSTTMKVLRGGTTEKRIRDLAEKPETKVKVSETERHLLYGEPFDTKIIKQYCDRPETKIHEDRPILDNSLAYVTRDLEVIEAPPKPAVLKKQGPIRALMTALSHFKKTLPTSRKDKSAPRRREERGGASGRRRRAKRKERPRPHE